MAAVFVLAATRAPELARRPFVWGPLYGVALYLTMNFVVRPLSAMPPKGAAAADARHLRRRAQPHLLRGAGDRAVRTRRRRRPRRRMNAPVAKPNSWAAWPDAQGRFGDYGGRYVPETLMPLVLELDRAYAAAKADPAFQAEIDRFATHYVGRPSPLYLAERLTAHHGGGAHLSQARRAEPHRLAQGEQHRRPDPARAAHGQEPHHRRDGRRPARRRHRHPVRPLRPAVRGLHGRGGTWSGRSPTCSA